MATKKRPYHDISKRGAPISERRAKRFKGRQTDVIHVNTTLPDEARLIVCPIHPISPGDRYQDTVAILWTPRRCAPALCGRVAAILDNPAAPAAALQFMALGPGGVEDWDSLPLVFRNVTRAELGFEQLSHRIVTLAPYPVWDEENPTPESDVEEEEN